MAQANINIRVDADLKQDFERLCRDIGMNISTAFNVIMKQSVRENQLPVQLKGDPYAISKEELLHRIALLDEGYKVEKTMEELEAMENE